MSSGNRICVRTKRLLLQAALTLAILVLLSAPRAALAQHHGGGGPGGGGPGGFGGGMGDRGMAGEPMREGFPRGGEVPHDMSRPGTVRPRGGLQLGPPGRWWDDKHYVKQLKLTDEQQHRMDAIFEQNRTVLLKRYETLEQEELRMDALAHAKTMDEPALSAQIDRVEQARADLGKATMHYLVQLRNELGADQIAKLEDQR